MGKRTTVYNAGLTDNWDSVSKENKGLVDEFVEYLVSVADQIKKSLVKGT